MMSTRDWGAKTTTAVVKTTLGSGTISRKPQLQHLETVQDAHLHQLAMPVDLMN